MELAKNWRIIYDDTNVVLQFYETRTRNKVEKVKGKLIPTGETEDYEFTDSRYYPSVQSALAAYIKLAPKGSESIKEIVKRIDDAVKKVEGFIKKYKKYI